MTLDPVIHQPTRLHIMAALFHNGQMSFTDLRDGLGLTPGNLGAHVEKLQEVGYVKSGRVLVDLSFELQYRLTDAGARAFEVYLGELRTLLGEGPMSRMISGAAEGGSADRAERPEDNGPSVAGAT